MNKVRFFSFVFFLVLLTLGAMLSMGNKARKQDEIAQANATFKDTAKTELKDTFKMPGFDAQAIKKQEEAYVLSQMSEQELMDYQQYMQQMAYQEQYERELAKYNRETQNRKPPVLDKKTESKIEKLKREFEEKRWQDSIGRSLITPSVD